MIATGTLVWVESLVSNDIGAHGKAIVVEDADERTTVKMLNGDHAGMTLSIPHAGILPYVEGPVLARFYGGPRDGEEQEVQQAHPVFFFLVPQPPRYYHRRETPPTPDTITTRRIAYKLVGPVTKGVARYRYEP